MIQTIFGKILKYLFKILKTYFFKKKINQISLKN